MSQRITSISGIRGIPGDSLLPPDIVRYTAAFSRFSAGGRVVVGYDGRPSGKPIKDIVLATLQLCGVHAIDLGLAPTPTVQVGVEKWNAAGGISITASHNPSEWNGLKFLDKTGIFLNAEQNARLFHFASEDTPDFADWKSIGTISIDTEITEKHLDIVLASPFVDAGAIRQRAFTVVVDAVNASGSFIVPELLRRLGCTVIPLHCDGSGIFPHLPEPLPENLAALGTAVRSHKADLGVAVDPDADRLVLYSETGEPFGEEYTITAAVDSVLSRISAQKHAAPKGGKNGDITFAPSVVVNLSTTRAVEDVAMKYSGMVLRAPVGEINVVRKMIECGAIIGGEGSGGVIVPSIHAGRDSLVAIALILDVLARHAGAASGYRATLPSYTMVKSKFSTADISSGEALSRVAVEFADKQINTEDGIRIDFSDMWVQMRASNTEPIIRIIAEAATREAALDLVERVWRTAANRAVSAGV